MWNRIFLRASQIFFHLPQLLLPVQFRKRSSQKKFLTFVCMAFNKEITCFFTQFPNIFILHRKIAYRRIIIVNFWTTFKLSASVVLNWFYLQFSRNDGVSGTTEVCRTFISWFIIPDTSHDIAIFKPWYLMSIWWM